MGAKVMSPKVQILEFRNGVLRLYDTGTDHLTVVKNQAQMDSFLTLGFGASGKDLAKAWRISDLGDEVLDGVKTAKLDLVPKDPAVRNNCTHMTIWIDPSRDVTGVILMQLLPFADKKCLEAFAVLEAGVYAGLDAAGQKAA